MISNVHPFRVLESKHEKYLTGMVIFAPFGWRTHTIFDPEQIEAEDRTADDKPMILSDFGDLPHSLGLGYLGQVGYTGYFGFLEICQPKSGETVVVTAAAGAVGSLVGQIAKIKGCRVVGLAGSDEKCKWLETELGFDKAINYKVANVTQELKEAAPNGIDCYFDNVGGKLSSLIIEQMNENGRIAVCGAISTYNDEQVMVPAQQFIFIMKQLRMEGFSWRWIDRYMEAIDQIRDWISEGKIKYFETVTEGFENQPKAFIEMMKGKNIGKAVVKV